MTAPPTPSALFNAHYPDMPALIDDEAAFFGHQESANPVVEPKAPLCNCKPATPMVKKKCTKGKIENHGREFWGCAQSQEYSCKLFAWCANPNIGVYKDANGNWELITRPPPPPDNLKRNSDQIQQLTRRVEEAHVRINYNDDTQIIHERKLQESEKRLKTLEDTLLRVTTFLSSKKQPRADGGGAAVPTGIPQAQK